MAYHICNTDALLYNLYALCASLEHSLFMHTCKFVGGIIMKNVWCGEYKMDSQLTVTTTTTINVLRPFVRDYPGESVPEG